MKAALAGILILIGLVCVVLSFFAGNAPPETPDNMQKYEELSQLVTATHPTPTQRKENAARKKEMEEQRARMDVIYTEIAADQAGAKFRKSLLWFTGLGLTLCGVAVQVLDWTTKSA